MAGMDVLNLIQTLNNRISLLNEKKKEIETNLEVLWAMHSEIQKRESAIAEIDTVLVQAHEVISKVDVAYRKGA